MAITRALFLTCALVIGLPMATSQVELVLDTPSVYNTTTPTVFGLVGEAVNTTLVPSGSAVMLYGVVGTLQFNSICSQLDSSSISVNATKTDSVGWGSGSFNGNLSIISESGCSPDSGSTPGTAQLLVTDPHDRTVLADCASTADSQSCAIYWLGEDVDSVYRTASATLSGQDPSNALTDPGCASALGNAQVALARDIFANSACHFVPFLSDFYRGACSIAARAANALVVGVGMTSGQVHFGCASSPAVQDLGACNCSDECCNECFPGDATVQLEGGATVQMRQLNIGDKVAVDGRNGHVKYDYVYAFGHRDNDTAAPFVRLALEAASSAHFIELSGGHFIKAASGRSAAPKYMRARDVMEGDHVWTSKGSDDVASFTVTEITTEYQKGLFNPLTLSGTIIVNGVVASVHSDWFLDGLFDRLGMTSALPAAYQAVLFPARAIFYTAGKDNYVKLYHFLDELFGGLDILGTNHGASISTAGIVACTAVLGVAFRATYKKAIMA